MVLLVLPIVSGLLITALLLAFLRLARGPTLADRVVALDLIGMTIAGMIAAYIAYMGEPVFLDALLVLAIITFFGAIAVARYLEKKPRDDR